MRKGITALLDQQGKEIFNEVLKINPLKNISFTELEQIISQFVWMLLKKKKKLLVVSFPNS